MAELRQYILLDVCGWYATSRRRCEEGRRWGETREEKERVSISCYYVIINNERERERAEVRRRGFRV